MATDEVKTVEERPESSDSTGALIYEPERPGRRRIRKPRPLVAYRKQEKNGSSSTEPSGDDSVETPDLDETFQYRGDGRDDERAVRAASFLLDWATGEGNEQVDPVLVQGISRALSLAADNIGRELRRRPQEHSQDQ
jgi:hypothetical protein